MTRPLLIMFLMLLLIAGGLGLYANHFRKRVADEERRLAEQASTALPIAGGPLVPVVFYIASDADGTLHRQQDSLSLPEERSERARAVLRALLAKYAAPSSMHPVGAGSDIRDVFLMGGDTAIVDTSAGFADSHPSGVMAEELTIASLVETLTANDPRIRRMKILVDGKERETLAGHADLQRFYTPTELEVFAKDTK